jgi:hypothetical protein
MKDDYTHITVILDRTGSMESIRDDTIGGFNAFLNEQKNHSEKATLSLIQFDSHDPYEEIHQFKPLTDIPELTRNTYIPRAATPLLDALGRGINTLENNLSALEIDSRPSKIIFVVITDGMENASQEFSRDQIEKMIKEKTEKEGWQFVFLSADFGAIKEAGDIGFQTNKAFLFVKDSKGSMKAWDALSKRTSEYRSNIKKQFFFEQEDYEDSDDSDKNN